MGLKQCEYKPRIEKVLMIIDLLMVMIWIYIYEVIRFDFLYNLLEEVIFNLK
jgi:hypothetical protein